jgi:hypothetical protein
MRVPLVRPRQRISNRTNRGLAPIAALVLLFTGTLMSKKTLTFKQTDLHRAIRTSQKAGLSIAKVEIDRDGKIVVVVGDGKKAEDTVTELDRWLAKQGNKPCVST